jgi:hypothetical protein
MPGEIFDFQGVFSQLAQISCAMTIGLGISNATIYRRNPVDRAPFDWVMVSAGWTRD